MLRNRILMSVASLAIIASAPALAKPGGGGGGEQGRSGKADMDIGRSMDRAMDRTIDRINADSMGREMRDLGRLNSQGPANANPRALERANSNSVLSGAAGVNGTATRIRGNDRSDRLENRTVTGSRLDGASASGSVKLTGVTTGMTVVDASGATVGTVSGVSTKGNGSARNVQVTLTDGTVITLSPRSLSLNGDVLTTTSTTTNANALNRRVNSQGAAHASVRALTRASPNSALATAGVTTLTGLATGLSVNNSGGTAIGTVDSILTNRAGAVVGIRVDLTAGGTVFIPATTLSMDGTTVVTSSTQF